MEMRMSELQPTEKWVKIETIFPSKENEVQILVLQNETTKVEKKVPVSQLRSW